MPTRTSKHDIQATTLSMARTLNLPKWHRTHSERAGCGCGCTVLRSLHRQQRESLQYVICTKATSIHTESKQMQFCRERCTLVYFPLMIATPHVCTDALSAWSRRHRCAEYHSPQALDIACRSSLDIAITQESEAILVPVANVVVFEPWILDSLEEVDGRARPQVDAVLDLVKLSGQCVRAPVHHVAFTLPSLNQLRHSSCHTVAL